MKRILALILATLMFTCLFAGCGSEEDIDGKVDEINSDVWSAQEEGKLTIGMTLYKPMNYKDDEGNLTGFETAFAKLVCRELNVEPEFVEIEWDSMGINLTASAPIGGQSSEELDATEIRVDCVWNGQPVLDGSVKDVVFSVPYLQDSQVLVVSKADKEIFEAAYNNEFIFKTFYTQGGSVASSVVKEDEFFGKDTMPMDTLTMHEALVEVSNAAKEEEEDKAEIAADNAKALEEAKAEGTEAEFVPEVFEKSDLPIAVVSKAMAREYVGEGKEFSDLAIIEGKEFAPSEIRVAFRQNSDLKDAVNAAITKLMTPAEGETESEFDKLVKKYGLEDMLIPKAE
ncbi:MAG: transporter substrate-binding domain-containing protein [Oscillospiraceae bacterium]|nr:transporter substrate-binding domain-containing protein [Oscillospiraceae bacterium]